MSEVVAFKPQLVGEAFRFDADQLLEAPKGQGFATLVIMGELEDGSIWVSGTANAGESLVLIEKAKRQIVFGDE